MASVTLPAVPAAYEPEQTASVADLTPNNHQLVPGATLTAGTVIFNRPAKVRVGTSTDDAGSITLINIYGEICGAIPAVKSGEYIPGVYRGISAVSNVSNVTVHYSGPNKVIVGTEDPV